jgi:hypothetical protein
VPTVETAAQVLLNVPALSTAKAVPETTLATADLNPTESTSSGAATAARPPPAFQKAFRGVRRVAPVAKPPNPVATGDDLVRRPRARRALDEGDPWAE